MNVSAFNSTQMKPQTSFGREYQVEDAEHIIELSEKLNDSFTSSEKPQIKSAGGIFASVLCAILTSFILGKCAASKIMTAFPGTSKKVTEGLANGLKKGADNLKNYADDVANGVKLQKGGKYTKMLGGKVASVEEFARNKLVKMKDKIGLESMVTNAVGIASVATIAPEVLKVDGNNDGVSDIAQRNVSAYKNAMKNVGLVSEIIDSLS